MNRSKNLIKRLKKEGITAVCFVLLFSHFLQAKRFPSYVPQQVRAEIVVIESNAGRYVYPDGCKELRKPFAQNTFNSLLTTLDSDNIYLRLAALDLIYLTLRDHEVPNDLILNQLMPTIKALLKKGTEHDSERSSLRLIEWIYELNRASPSERLDNLKKVLYDDWDCALESIRLLARIGNEDVKQILLDRLQAEEDSHGHSNTGFAHRLRTALIQLETFQRLNAAIDNTGKIDIIKEVLVEEKNSNGDMPLLYFIIRQLKNSDSKLEDDLLISIGGDLAFPLEMRMVIKELLRK